MTSTTSNVRRICDALKIKAGLLPDRIAHDDTRRAITFREWDAEVDDVAGGLAAAGLLAGERIFLAIDNNNAVEMAIATLAVMRAGGIAVPLNTRLSPTETRTYYDLIEPRFAITNVPERLSGLPLEKVWSVDDMPRALAALPDQSGFDANADAMILGTSGTTGAIKGVVNSHPNLMHLVGDGCQVQKHHNATLHALPFTSSGGMHGELLLPLVGGATCYTQPRFDPAGFLQLVATKRPTTLYFVPTMLRLILDHPEVAKTDFSSVRHILTGTAPLPHDSAARALALWPHINMRNSYGMSEGGASASTKSNEALLKPGCVGQMPPTMQIRDDSGAPVASGIVGEIYGKASHPRRYWRDTEGSKKGWVGDWTRTGDLGYVDSDGDLIISGRLKEIIIRGGFNLSPVEIENVLYAHPAVKDAAVVGISHAILGEDAAAAVTLNSGFTVTPEALGLWCKERLADNKIPRTIVIVDALPLNANSKVVKRELKPVLERADAERRARAEAKAE